MLAAIDLTLNLAGRTLFDGVRLSLDRGVRIGLVGPNGVGKSTLLRVLAGEIKPDRGSVTLRRDSRLSYLPQELPRQHDGSVLGRVLQARPEVVSLQTEVDATEKALAHAEPTQALALAAHLADARARLELAGGSTYLSGAKEILLGLGFDHAALDKPSHLLSGGWWMRVELARLLHASADVLLLDEPTNHLDTTSLQFLENFLRRYPGGCLVVSHDRAFLNSVVQQVAELQDAALTLYSGNFDAYREARLKRQEERAAQAAAQRKKQAHDQAFIDRFRSKASKAAQVQSRIKRLEKEAPIAAATPQGPRLHIALPAAPRAGKIVATLAGVSKRFGDKRIFEAVDWQLPRGARVALVGKNGAGKSTLLKILAGVLPIDAGSVTLGHAVTSFYYAQHTLDTLNADDSVLASLAAVMPDASNERLRAVLGAFLFDGQSLDKNVAKLSGGEKARLALARMLCQPHNLLLLDEPTNHLDLHSRGTLEATLKAYAGTLVFISHDRAFVDALATHVMTIEAGAPLHMRDIDAATAPAQISLDDVPEFLPKKQSERGAAHATAKAQARLRERQRREQGRLEAEIVALEHEVAELDAALCDPDNFADAERCQALASKRQELEGVLLQTMETWEALCNDA